MSNLGSNPTVIITGPRAAGVRDELPLERHITHEFAPEGAAEAYARLDRRDPEVLQCVFSFAPPAVHAPGGSVGEHEHA